MKLEILDAAEQDLINGFNFYEIQSPGLGQYFLDSIYADIESLLIYRGIHQCALPITGYLLSGFHLQFTIALKMSTFGFMQSWIVERIRNRYMNV